MNIAYKIAVPFVVFFITFIVFINFFVRDALTDVLFEEEFTRITETVKSEIPKRLERAYFDNPVSSFSARHFQGFFDAVSNSLIHRISLWDNQYRIVHSNRKSIIGFSNPGHKDLKRLFSEKRAFFERKETDDNEPIESWLGEFSDIYIPILISGEIVGALEIHLVNAAVLGPVRREINIVIFTLVGGSLAMLGALLAVIHSVVILPLSRLRTEIVFTGEGDFDHRITTTSSDELGILAKTFDAMRLKVKSLLDSIREERDRSLAIISSMGEGLVVIDKEGVILLANPIVKRLLNTPHDTLVGKDVFDVLPISLGDKKLSRNEHPAIKTLLAGVPSLSTIEQALYIHPVGAEKLPIIMVSTPLRGNGVTGAVIVFRDISAEKQLDEAKTNFISVASHQLRTPLTAVRWYTEMLENGDAGELTRNQKEFVHQIYVATARLIETVNMLLSLARIEGGRLRVEPIGVNLVTFTKTVAQELEQSIREKKLILTIHEIVLPNVSMDASMLQQVIMNLFTNAIRYAPERGTIDVSFKEDKDIITFSIKDDGIGIPEKQKSRIFERFFRADNAIQKSTEGTGLGLNLVKALVNLWGGRIWFESPTLWEQDGRREYKGTLFAFSIPLKGMEPKFVGKSLA